MSKGKHAYQDAGVGIDRAQECISRVGSDIRNTYRPEVIEVDGAFGGLFALDTTRYAEPVLVSSVDGVGTKLMVASMMNRHRSVGVDLVHHCINDIACHGAEPLFFMDYLGIGRLRDQLYHEVLSGMAGACREHGVALLGGETAEMPGMYGDDYDLVGAITGVVDRAAMITGTAIAPGDRVLGLPSSGLHTNGYSLARRIFFEHCGWDVTHQVDEHAATIGDVLLEPHRCYWPAIRLALQRKLPIRGIAHITGGGWYDNLARILPAAVDAVLQPAQTSVPPIFRLLEEHGNVDTAEMYRVFNMGIGMMWVVPPSGVANAVAIAGAAGVAAIDIGVITDGTGAVRLTGIDDTAAAAG